MDKRKYQFDKLKHRKTGYPTATVAYYGPDNQFASKVVVAIKLSENDEELNTMKKMVREGAGCTPGSIHPIRNHRFY